MERKRRKQQTVFALTVLLGTAFLGCSSRTTPQVPEQRSIEVAERVPGAVYEEWVEPMFDTVHVPGQLDPAGNYYRMPHQTVVEIRPGRFEQIEYQGER